MNKALDIRPADLATVGAILREALGPHVRVWVFGSRAKGKARRGSDLDLAVDAGHELTLQELGQLHDAFDECDLPYTVDVVDWRAIDPRFRAAIEGDLVELDVTGEDRAATPP
jgi:predicted nucleotidyltransferase